MQTGDNNVAFLFHSRHPDCSRPTSLVVSTITLTLVASTNVFRGEEFAGEILSVVLAFRSGGNGAVGVPGNY